MMSSASCLLSKGTIGYLYVGCRVKMVPGCTVTGVLGMDLLGLFESGLDRTRMDGNII